MLTNNVNLNTKKFANIQFLQAYILLSKVNLPSKCNDYIKKTYEIATNHTKITSNQKY